MGSYPRSLIATVIHW